MRITRGSRVDGRQRHAGRRPVDRLDVDPAELAPSTTHRDAAAGRRGRATCPAPSVPRRRCPRASRRPARTARAGRAGGRTREHSTPKELNGGASSSAITHASSDRVPTRRRERRVVRPRIVRVAARDVRLAARPGEEDDQRPAPRASARDVGRSPAAAARTRAGVARERGGTLHVARARLRQRHHRTADVRHDAQPSRGHLRVVGDQAIDQASGEVGRGRARAGDPGSPRAPRGSGGRPRVGTACAAVASGEQQRARARTTRRQDRPARTLTARGSSVTIRRRLRTPDQEDSRCGYSAVQPRSACSSRSPSQAAAAATPTSETPKPHGHHRGSRAATPAAPAAPPPRPPRRPAPKTGDADEDMAAPLLAWADSDTDEGKAPLAIQFKADIEGGTPPLTLRLEVR